jgi:hypothetical protein
MYLLKNKKGWSYGSSLEFKPQSYKNQKKEKKAKKKKKKKEQQLPVPVGSLLNTSID